MPSHQNPCNDRAEVYRSLIVEQGPRVLSLMDREALSPTRGCCDRTYWAWKFVDFPGARFQEALCVLSFLYVTDLDESPYYRNGRLLEWISHGFRFWASVAHRDGSFDEAYPFERSLAATAFTTFYAGEAIGLLGDDIPSDIAAIARQTVAKAGEWLVKNDETHGFLSNHLAAAAGALSHAYRICGDDEFDRRSRYFLERIMGRQSKEGWYDEYGGADPGYQTHGAFYLTRCWQLCPSETLAASLKRSMVFLSHFVHPDGSLGGEYASRNTQTYYPAAFEMFAPQHPAAAWIADSMRESVGNAAAVGLRSVDSYNYFPFLNNLVFAYLACVDENNKPVEAEEPSSGTGLVWFPEAGIARVRRDHYDAYVGTRKGAVMKVFDRRNRTRLYSDCGYVGRLRGGRVISTQHDDVDAKVHVQFDRIVVDGKFSELSRPVMTPFRFVAFRLFTLSVGRFPSLGRWLKRLLVRVLIYRKRALDIRFRRRIEFDDLKVNVHDHVVGQSNAQIEAIRWGDVFTTIHMGSARYFISNELDEDFVSAGVPDQEIELDQIPTGVELQRTVAIPEGGA